MRIHLIELRIVSGGQTGVDRAALDVAMTLGIPSGGWCPRGRLAEDGLISEKYPLVETKSRRYSQRTRCNVRDSDGTLILTVGESAAGTALTVDIARELPRPLLVVDLSQRPEIRSVVNWVFANKISALNIAGPRESAHPGVYDSATRFLTAALSAVISSQGISD